MSAPISPEHGTKFELAAIAEELKASAPYLREGHTARTLVRTSDLRIVVLVLAAGKSIASHEANATASVQTLTGHVRLQLPDRTVEVGQGEVLVLGAGLPHDVHAEADSVLLLSLGWPSPSEPGAGGRR